MKSVLGETDGRVLHAPIPFHLSGQADVLLFPKHIPGRVTATCELLGFEEQIKNQLGTYELIIAHRDDTEWGPTIISRLARYTCEACLDPGDNMDIAPAVPTGSPIAGFLFLEYARFQYRNQNAGLLLCIGITSDELQHCKNGAREEIVAALKERGVYPYTDLFRRSVL